MEEANKRRSLRETMAVHRQISETIGLGILLALSGGLMDAYSYLFRGEVFANAQTGNILLMSVHFSQGNWPAAFQYLCPVAAFAAGILISLVIRHYFLPRPGLHWRQLGVLAELILLALVAFIPQEFNLLANSLISLACGYQVETFRKIHGNSIATTMCIGNLRSAIHAAAEFGFTGKREERKKALIYLVVIFAFAAGAVLGNLAIQRWQSYAIWGSSLLLLACFFLMFLNPENKK